MKVYGQDLSGALATLLQKLARSGTVKPDGSQVSRTRKRALKVTLIIKKPKVVTDIEAAADALIQYQKNTLGNTAIEATRLTIIANLKRGIFDPTYWTSCAIASTQTLACTPSSSTFTGTRNYSYPDPLYQPTDTTYGNGSNSTGNPQTAGEVVGVTYYDTLLKWKRVVFTLPRAIGGNDNEPVFMKIYGTITGTASAQAARVLLSGVAKCWLVPASSSRPATTEPPTNTPMQNWFKYVTPRGTAPYWNVSQPFKMQHSVRNKNYEESATANTKAVVLFSPAPIKGRRYNNNASVSSTLAATTEIWVIKKVTWEFANLAQDGSYIYIHRNIATNGTLYVHLDSTGTSGHTGAFTSTDLKTWSQTINDMLPTTGDDNCIAYGNGVFVAVPDDQYSSGLWWTSTDGYNFTGHQTGLGPPTGSNIIFALGLFIVIAEAYSDCWTSPDGINWTQRTTPNIYGYGNAAIAFNDSTVVIINKTRNDAYYSDDGITWGHAALPANGTWFAVDRIGATFVAVQRSGTYYATSDDNGRTWTARTLPANKTWAGMAGNNDKLLLVPYEYGTGYYSTTDGITWTAENLPEAATKVKAQFVSKFIMNTNDNRIIYSARG